MVRTGRFVTPLIFLPVQFMTALIVWVCPALTYIGLFVLPRSFYHSLRHIPLCGPNCVGHQRRRTVAVYIERCVSPSVRECTACRAKGAAFSNGTWRCDEGRPSNWSTFVGLPSTWSSAVWPCRLVRTPSSTCQVAHTDVLASEWMSEWVGRWNDRPGIG